MVRQKVFDKPAALERVCNDGLLLIELYGLFLSEYEAGVTALRTAIQLRDNQAVEAAAHSFKSSLGNIGAMRAFEAAHELEKAGRENSLDLMETLFGLFLSEIRDFKLSFEEARPSLEQCKPSND